MLNKIKKTLVFISTATLTFTTLLAANNKSFVNTTTPITSFNTCSTLFVNRPSVISDKILTESKNIQELCNTHYAVLYSYLTETPLYSYEKEQQEDVTVKRDSTFVADNRVPVQYRSTLKDYLNSGYDKGHLTPSGDMNDINSQHETFLLSNIAPQSSKLNQQAWRLMEKDVKPYTYKITGVLFTSPTITKVGNVTVPSNFYKIVSDGTTCSKAFIAENKDNASIQPISLNDLNKLTNIDFHLPTKQCD